MRKDSKNKRLYVKLQEYADKFDIKGKGPLSVVLIINRNVRSKKPPFSSKDFLTPKGGQVAGLSGRAVQNILSDYGISRPLAEEGGRTSRGSIRRMEGYIALLNDIAAEGPLDFPAIESWWIERVKEYFATEPFKLKIDPSKSLRRIVGEMINAAFKRQEECPGVMIAGTVMQHLVGAKLEIALPSAAIEHRGASVADAPGRRKGDFIVSDTAIHVTTAPTEALIRKCGDNLGEGLRPVIITTDSGVGGARALAKNADIEDWIDILEVEQFVATNVYEWSRFASSKRSVSVGELVKAYNKIIDMCETDPSLKIAMD